MIEILKCHIYKLMISTTDIDNERFINVGNHGSGIPCGNIGKAVLM